MSTDEASETLEQAAVDAMLKRAATGTAQDFARIYEILTNAAGPGLMYAGQEQRRLRGGSCVELARWLGWPREQVRRKFAWSQRPPLRDHATVTRVYARQGTYAHLLPQTQRHEDGWVLCGQRPRRFQVWSGSASRDEQEHAAKLPLCPGCAASPGAKP